MKVKILFVLGWLIFLMSNSLAFADTVTLKSGKKINGKVVERTKDYVKIEIEGITVTYWRDEIENVIEDKSTLSQELISEDKQESLEGEYRKKVFQYIKEQNYEEANKYLKKILELKPDSVYAHINLGFSYYRLGKFEEALDNLKRAITIDPNNATAYALLGITYRALEKEAKDALLKFVDLSKKQAKSNEDSLKAFTIEKIVEMINN